MSNVGSQEAYYAIKNAEAPIDSAGHGGVAVQTTYAPSVELERKLGMSTIVFSDLVNTRDSIALTVILRLQSALGIEVVTQKDIEEACASYISYVFGKN